MFQGILADDASIISPNNECLNGVIHVIDKVLYPPRDHIYGVLKTLDPLRYRYVRTKYFWLNPSHRNQLFFSVPVYKGIFRLAIVLFKS